jgi:hypothetical protein
VLTEAPLDALHHSATDHGDIDLASLGHLESDALSSSSPMGWPRLPTPQP